MVPCSVSIAIGAPFALALICGWTDYTTPLQAGKHSGEVT
jgi:hypothetical protein